MTPERARPPRQIRNEGEAYAVARGMVEEELILPGQIASGSRNDSLLSGEKALMLAILEDAIRCYQGHLKAPRIRPRLLEQRAADWIAAEDYEYIFSFASICEHLGFDPSALRAALYKSKAQAQGSTDKFYRLHLRGRRRKGT